MYTKNNKQRLYWLIDQYLLDNIDEQTFCDEFYYSYDLELDYETLTEIEKKAFAELSEVSSRFSQNDNDHKLDSRAFSTLQELRQKIIEAKIKLQSE